MTTRQTSTLDDAGRSNAVFAGELIIHEDRDACIAELAYLRADPRRAHDAQ